MLERLTVPQLRARCKAAGLPAYQRAGRRLRKSDLIEQLHAHERPVPSDPDAELIHALATLPLDPRDAPAMHRVLRSVDSPSDRRHLDGRKLQALQRLRDASSGSIWGYWAERYNLFAAGMMA